MCHYRKGDDLRGLWNGTYSSLKTMDGANTYTKEELISIIAILLQNYSPNMLIMQDFEPYGNDHLDHTYGSYLVMSAINRLPSPSFTIIPCRGYSFTSLPRNLTQTQHDRKLQIWQTYCMYDKLQAGAQPALIEAYMWRSYYRTFALTSTVSTVLTSVTTATIVGLQMQVVSNSLVSDLVFDSTRGLLNFTISGPSGCYGFIDATIAKTLLLGRPVVLIDGTQHSALVNEDATFWYVHVTYTHSEHHVTIGGSDSIPEFPSFPLLVVTFVLVLVILRRRANRATSQVVNSDCPI